MDQRTRFSKGFTLVEYALVSVMADTALAHGLSGFLGLSRYDVRANRSSPVLGHGSALSFWRNDTHGFAGGL